MLVKGRDCSVDGFTKNTLIGGEAPSDKMARKVLIVC